MCSNVYKDLLLSQNNQENWEKWVKGKREADEWCNVALAKVYDEFRFLPLGEVWEEYVTKVEEVSEEYTRRLAEVFDRIFGGEATVQEAMQGIESPSSTSP